MRGRDGLVLVLFGGFFAMARQFNIGDLRQLDPQIARAIYVVAILGFSSVVVGTLGRLWAASR
jgi:hypothetical protein